MSTFLRLSLALLLSLLMACGGGSQKSGSDDEPIVFTLTYLASPGGTLMGVSPQSVEAGAQGTEVTALPDNGYHFTQWSDGLVTAARIDTDVQADIAVTAGFSLNQYAVIYAAAVGGSISGIGEQQVGHGGDATSVTAVADNGFVFSGWSDGVAEATRTDTNIAAALSVTAQFTEDGVEPPDPELPDYWPTSAWQSADPVLLGFEEGALDTLTEDAQAALPGLTSLMIIRNGYVVHESYHTPEGSAEEVGPETKHNVWSVTKSVSSLATGAAVHNGLIAEQDLDLTTNDFFADMMASYEEEDGRRDIRFRDVLQMRSGLSWSEANELINFTVYHIYLPDPSCSNDDTLTICSLLRKPLAHTPGTVWNYNTYDSYLLASFFYHLTDYSLSDYARQFLLSPMGITLIEDDWSYWPPSATNDRYTYGGGLSQYRTQDIARIGLLVLHRGQWDGQQLVAPDWFDLSLEPLGEGLVVQFDDDGAALPEPVVADISYGMQWWTRTGPSFTGPDSITARGLGGQYLMIFPEHDLIVAATHKYDLGESVPDRTPGFVSFLQSQVIDQIID